MSCGNPHETDCSDVLDLVDEYLDGELDDDRRLAIEEHFAECTPCVGELGREQTVKALVYRSCACSAPERLRVQIVARIRQISITYRSFGE